MPPWCAASFQHDASQLDIIRLHTSTYMYLEVLALGCSGSIDDCRCRSIQPQAGPRFPQCWIRFRTGALGEASPHHAIAPPSTFTCISILILTYPIRCRYQITQWATSGALRPLIASKLQSASPRLGTAMEYFKAKPSTEQVRSKVEESSNKVSLRLSIVRRSSLG